MPMPTPPRNEPAIRDLLELYRQVDAEVERLGPVCLGGGACCRFDRMGHRLYISALERLGLLACPQEGNWNRALRLRCPYQRGPACLARQYRPLGCRTYFCRGPAEQFQVLYEQFHAHLRCLHEQHGIEYIYGSLTDLLGREETPRAGEICVDSAREGP